MNKELTIALLGRDLLWGGGAELVRNIANALLFVKDEHRTKLFLLLPIRNKIDTFKDARRIIIKILATAIREKKIVIPKQESVFGASYFDYFKNIDGTIEIVEYNETTGLIPALQKIEADVVMLAPSSLGKSFPLPWVGYIYDFQHKYYPDYFSASECLNRDIHFATMLRDAKAIIVNAKSVKDDVYKFYPYCNCKIFNLPFSASPVSSWLEEGNLDILERYGLPSRYFLISNQFWIHKSHITTFLALGMLMSDKSCADIHIVCTGKMEDYRFPDHIQSLQQKIHELELEDKVRFLGHIPKIDQIAIMKKSLAVLQPTLFEGGPGGGSVYDALSLGIPVILSDIPVNREIDEEENLFYFQAGSATDLADKIRTFLKQDIRRPEKEELIAQGEQRKRMLEKRLLEAVHYVRGT